MGEGIRRGDIRSRGILRRTLVSVVVFWDTTLIYQCLEIGVQTIERDAEEWGFEC